MSRHSREPHARTMSSLAVQFCLLVFGLMRETRKQRVNIVVFRGDIPQSVFFGLDSEDRKASASANRSSMASDNPASFKS